LAAKSPPRRHLSAAIAAIERHNGPADARLSGLHQQAAALRAADELTTWARDHAAALEPFAPHEAAAVGHLAAIIDARVAGSDDAPAS
jgi:hypothetical protein